jgi:hypothetical protein
MHTDWPNMRLETDLRNRSRVSRASAAQPSRYALGEDQMKQFLWLFVSAVGMPALLSCGGASNAAGTSLEAQFAVLVEGGWPAGGVFTKKQAKVISTQNDYAAELVTYRNAVPASLDFTKGRVLLVDMGPRPSGGHGIRVASVDVADSWVIANVELVKPGPQCGVTAVVTNPYQFVFIPTLKEILLSEKVVVWNC